MEIRSLTRAEAAARMPELCALLQDVVDGGASVGFLPPLAPAEAHDYWSSVLPQIHPTQRRLFVALEGDALLGSVQLNLSGFPNGAHRGEVNKLLVHRRARRRGVGAALMLQVHEAAIAAGRRLLVLDTVVGEDAERLYRRLGWQAAGIIPGYARNGAGGYDPTLYMYKELEALPPGMAL